MIRGEIGLFLGIVLIAAGCGGSKSQSLRENTTAREPEQTWTAKFFGPLPDKKKESKSQPVSNPAKLFGDPINSTSASPPVSTLTQAPKSDISVEIQTPPMIAPGQDMTVRIVARNDGSNATPLIRLRQPVPDTVQLLRSEPAAALKGSQLVWDLPQLMPGGSHSVVAVYRPAKPGSITLRADAVHGDKELGSAQTIVQTSSTSASISPMTTPTAAPVQLAVRVNGPSESRLGDTANFDVNIANTSQGPAGRVLLSADLGTGLEHESASRRLEIPIPGLASGENKTIQLPLQVREAGRLRLVVSAQAENSGAVREEKWLDVRAPVLELSLTGSSRVTLGQNGAWLLKVTNPGPSPAENVVVRTQLPGELTFRNAERGQFDRGQIVWSIGRLESRETRTVQFSATGNRLVDRSTLMASAIADRTPEVRAELPFEVLGTPMLKLSVRGSDQSVEVGGRVIYTVEIRNPGSLPLRDVEVNANVSPQLRPAFGSGPTVVRIEGQRVVCGRISVVSPGQAVAIQFEAEAVGPGDARVEVEARSAAIGQPVLQQEATRIIGK